jgi:hypothetical protein
VVQHETVRISSEENWAYMNIVLGIHGYAGVGKDALADAFVENYGFTKIAFADPVKEVLLDMNPLLRVENDEQVSLSEVVGTHGWDEAKDVFPEIRPLLVNLGQSMRKNVGQRVWVNTAFNRADGIQRVVYSDVRQLNEAALLKEFFGASLIHLIRPGVGPANANEGMSLPPELFKWQVNNAGDLTDLRAHADMIMSRIQFQREAVPA